MASCKTLGYVHSLESFGSVDGPGVRFVVFLQGCALRCKYCHNPETWAEGGEAWTAEALFQRVYRYRNYWGKKGGITVSGGEPLMQIRFVTELFTEAKKRGIHTCLDTSGITFHPENPAVLEQFDRLMAVTDLVLLDIKHIDPTEHEKLCSQPQQPVMAFESYLEEKKIPVWIRHVVVPGITDQEEYLLRLGQYLGMRSNIKALDVLPYHDMGKVKYKNLGIPYPLEHTAPLSKEAAAKARQIILKGMRESRGL